MKKLFKQLITLSLAFVLTLAFITPVHRYNGIRNSLVSPFSATNASKSDGK